MEEPCREGWPEPPPPARTMVALAGGGACSAPKPRGSRAEPIAERARGHALARLLNKGGLAG